MREFPSLEEVTLEDTRSALSSEPFVAPAPDKQRTNFPARYAKHARDMVRRLEATGTSKMRTKLLRWIEDETDETQRAELERALASLDAAAESLFDAAAIFDSLPEDYGRRSRIKRMTIVMGGKCRFTAEAEDSYSPFFECTELTVVGVYGARVKVCNTAGRLLTVPKKELYGC